MDTLWRVEQVTEKPGIVLAELVSVECFKENPEWIEMMARYTVIENEQGREEADRQSLEWPEIENEFLDAEPGEEGSYLTETRSRMTLDITEGPELHPLDVIRMVAEFVTRVDA